MRDLKRCHTLVQRVGLSLRIRYNGTCHLVRLYHFWDLPLEDSLKFMCSM